MLHGKYVIWLIVSMGSANVRGRIWRFIVVLGIWKDALWADRFTVWAKFATERVWESGSCF